MPSGKVTKIVACLLVVAFLVGLGAVPSNLSVQAASSSVATFNYSDVILGSNPSLSISVISINRTTGLVTVSGADSRQPTIPFTFNWGNGYVFEGFFPQTYTYPDLTRNYIITVTAHYSNQESASSQTLARFTAPTINAVPLPANISVFIPETAPNITFRLPNSERPLTGFNDSFFGLVNRTCIEYVLTAAAKIQIDFANQNVASVNGSFNQFILRDANFDGAYANWNTIPVSVGAGDFCFSGGSVQWSSLFHEMGHDVTLNIPAGYCIGNQTWGAAQSIYAEAMAQIFQHATAYELVNNAAQYGISDDLAFEIKQSALQSTAIVRDSYYAYLSSGKQFTSWNNYATSGDESFNTFMTLAYKFFVHAETAGVGYAIPTERMMRFLQTFCPADAAQYNRTINPPAAQTFRSTFMVTALSCAFGQDLRAEFRDLNFPINDTVYNELASRITFEPFPSPTPQPTATQMPTIPEFSQAIIVIILIAPVFVWVAVKSKVAKKRV